MRSTQVPPPLFGNDTMASTARNTDEDDRCSLAEHLHPVFTSRALSRARPASSSGAPVAWAAEPTVDVSPFQLCTAHVGMRSLHERGIFALGDGTGVGKTRTLCTMVRFWCDRPSAEGTASTVEDAPVLWLTANKTLARAARAQHASSSSRMFSSSPLPPSETTGSARGRGVSGGERVTFGTYAELVDRLDEFVREVRSVSYDGGGGDGAAPRTRRRALVVADECHLARRGKCADAFRTLVRSTGCALLLSSATMFADTAAVVHMGDVLGLWGPGRPWTTATAARRALLHGGSGMLSAVPLQLAHCGTYVARRLVTAPLPPEPLVCRMTRADRAAYDAVVEAVNARRRVVADAGPETGPSSAFVGAALRQRALLLILSAIKVRHVLSTVAAYVDDGWSVILSVCNTGAFADDADAPSCLASRVLRHQVDDDAHATLDAAVADYLNPLDVVTAHFGADRVAEVTGRRFRYVRCDRGWRRVARGSLRANVEAFQTDARPIALVSRAGGVGLSLHGWRGPDRHDEGPERPPPRPRVHIALDLPWSADQHVQVLGRAHRADVQTVPVLRVATLDVPADARVAETLYRRLRTLGRLTQADPAAYSTYGGRNLVDGGCQSTASSRRLLCLRVAMARVRARFPREHAAALRDATSRNAAPPPVEALLDDACEGDRRPTAPRSVLLATKRLQRVAEGRTAVAAETTVVAAIHCAYALYGGLLFSDVLDWSPTTHRFFPTAHRRVACAVARCAAHRSARKTLGCLPTHILHLVVRSVLDDGKAHVDTLLRTHTKGGPLDAFMARAGTLSAEAFANRVMHCPVHVQRAVAALVRTAATPRRGTGGASSSDSDPVDVGCLLGEGEHAWTSTSAGTDVGPLGMALHADYCVSYRDATTGASTAAFLSTTRAAHEYTASMRKIVEFPLPGGALTTGVLLCVQRR